MSRRPPHPYLEKPATLDDLQAQGLLVVPHPAQAQLLAHPARFKVVACGRRWGKTQMAKLALVERAMSGQQTWWLAPTYGMASQVWRDLRRIGLALQGQISAQERRIDLPNGGLMAARSVHMADWLRGAGLDYVVLDEAAYMSAEVWPQVVRPMLLDRRGGALFISTPRGQNWFWDVYRLGQDAQQPDWAAFHYPSASSPLIDPAELEAIRRVTRERVWREEYLAEFVADEGAVFRLVRQAVRAPSQAVYQPDHVYSVGIDWGREDDYTAIVVLDASARQMVALDRFHQIGWAVQRDRLRRLADAWHPALIYAESNAIGSPNIEALQAEGLAVRPFAMTASSKGPLIQALALAIEREELALLDDETLIGELLAYGQERLPSGLYRYSAPPGGHDDTVIALALAWHAAQSGGLRLEFF